MTVSKYRESFLYETADYLQSFAGYLFKLEQGPDEDTIKQLLRCVHTIKGMAAAMKYQSVVDLTHEMESVLILVGERRVMVTPPAVDLFFRCQDVLQAMVARRGSRGSRVFQPLILELHRLAGAAKLLPGCSPGDELPCQGTARNQLQDALEQGKQFFMARFTLAPDTVMKAARVFMVFQRIADHSAEIIKSDPPMQELQEERFGDRFDVVFATKEPEEAFMESLSRISEVSLLALERLEPGSVQRQAGWREQHDHKSATPVTLQSIRVEANRLDSLCQLVRELAVAETRLETLGTSISSPELQDAIDRIGDLTTSLQSIVRTIRMIPARQVFSRFPRMVRDLSRQLDKSIQLVIQGEEAELDRRVADEIVEPLVHLLRNAVDHGIESPQEREAAGKINPARLSVAACPQGNALLIEIADNGRGIDLDRIRAKALERGLLPASAVADESALLNLIFEPGFSTAEQVTNISGRGLGLDIVKDKITSLGGSIVLETRKGQGTTVKIRLPLPRDADTATGLTGG